MGAGRSVVDGDGCCVWRGSLRQASTCLRLAAAGSALEPENAAAAVRLSIMQAITYDLVMTWLFCCFSHACHGDKCQIPSYFIHVETVYYIQYTCPSFTHDGMLHQPFSFYLIISLAHLFTPARHNFNRHFMYMYPPSSSLKLLFCHGYEQFFLLAYPFISTPTAHFRH